MADNGFESWEFFDFQGYLSQAYDYIFYEMDGTLGRHAAEGVAVDLADAYAMASFKEGKAQAGRYADERDVFRARCAELESELKREMELRVNAEREAMRNSRMCGDDALEIRREIGEERVSDTAMIGNGDDCLMLLGDYLLGERRVDGIIDGCCGIEDLRCKLVGKILKERSKRYREECSFPKGKKRKKKNRKKGGE